MTEKEFKKITELLDDKITLYQAIGEPFGKDLDIAIKLSVAYEKLQQENQELKADYGNKAQVERDLLLEENQELKKQLNYLRSGEYYNQLRFERDMLQYVVDNGEVSKEDKEFIDMTHRNTELLEENKKLKKQLENANEQINYLRRSIERKEETIIDLQNERVPYTNEYVDKILNQQKEFIDYLENMLDNENDIFSVVRVKDVLSKYKETIGVKDEN